MNFRIGILFLGLMLCPLFAEGQAAKAHKQRKEGNKNYNRKMYGEAEKDYRNSTITDPNLKGSFNLGNAIFQQNRFDEAATEYEKALNLTADNLEKAKAWYNLGNAKYLSEDYEQSVEAYKNALKLNPEDLDAKQNLLMAMVELQQQQQQQQQQQNEEDQRDQDEQDQQQPQQDQPQQDQQQQQQSGEDESSQEPTQDLSKEQAEQLLKIIDEEDKKVQEKLRKKESGNKKKTKDW